MSRALRLGISLGSVPTLNWINLFPAKAEDNVIMKKIE